jgi:hypothetical protein
LAILTTFNNNNNFESTYLTTLPNQGGQGGQEFEKALAQDGKPTK